MSDMNYDVVIIGGGVTGCAAARELSRYDLRICLVEKLRMCAQEQQRQTAQLSMPAMMRFRERRKQDSI